MKNTLLLTLLVASLTLLNSSFSFGDVSSPLTELGELYYYAKIECEDEFSTYCNKAVFGRGRVINCIRKFEDKLSPRCEQAYIESLERLDKLLPKFLHSIEVCREDAHRVCSGLRAWSDQIADCVKLNKDKLSSKCKLTLQDYGWLK